MVWPSDCGRAAPGTGKEVTRVIGKLLVGCALAIACEEATRPAHWWHLAELGTAPNRIEQFIDQSSIRSNVTGHKVVSVAMILEQPLDTRIYGMKSVYEIDCRGGRSRSLGRAGLDIAGAPLAGTIVRQPLSWQREKPDSLAARVSEAACKAMPADAIELGDFDPSSLSRIYFGDRGH